MEGVKAYVEVRSKNENRSDVVISQLLALGARVEPKLGVKCTHVIFKGKIFYYVEVWFEKILTHTKFFLKKKEKFKMFFMIHTEVSYWFRGCFRSQYRTSVEIIIIMIQMATRKIKMPILFIPKFCK